MAVTSHPPNIGLASRQIHLVRCGVPYSSEDVERTELDSGPLAISLAPPLIIAHDAKSLRRSLSGGLHPITSIADRIAVITDALNRFRRATLDVPGLGAQSPDSFAKEMRAACGLPSPLIDRWMDTLDATFSEEAPQAKWCGGLELISLPANTFVCLSEVLSALMRADAVWVRPSRLEPFSSARLMAALIGAGWPADRLGFYPAGHSALRKLIDVADRAVVFGGDKLAESLSNRGDVEVRGAGRARAFVDASLLPDRAAGWLVPKIAGDGGRFCTGLGTIVADGDATAIGAAVAERLDKIELCTSRERNFPQALPGRLYDPLAVAAWVEDRLRTGDRFMTKRPLIINTDGHTTLAPSLVHLADIDGHPLNGVELPFPFAVIAEAPAACFPELCEGAGFVFALGLRRFAAETSGALTDRWIFDLA